jgi:hypothetical protein
MCAGKGAVLVEGVATWLCVRLGASLLEACMGLGLLGHHRCRGANAVHQGGATPASGLWADKEGEQEGVEGKEESGSSVLRSLSLHEASP